MMKKGNPSRELSGRVSFIVPFYQAGRKRISRPYSPAGRSASRNQRLYRTGIPHPGNPQNYYGFPTAVNEGPHAECDHIGLSDSASDLGRQEITDDKSGNDRYDIQIRVNGIYRLLFDSVIYGNLLSWRQLLQRGDIIP